MTTRIGGIQDVSFPNIEVNPESTCVTVSFKIPYRTLGCSKSEDFWALLLGQMGSFEPMLNILKELLQKNAPFLDSVVSAEFGSTKHMWKWLIAPPNDTRFYALSACTPDLLQFATQVEVKA